LVDIENGLVSREAFTSDAVYRDELDRIFDRSWIFLAHESEIPEPGIMSPGNLEARRSS